MRGLWAVSGLRGLPAGRGGDLIGKDHRATVEAVELFQSLSHRPLDVARAVALRAVGWRQAEIAGELGVSQQTLSRWFQGVRQLAGTYGTHIVLASSLLVVRGELGRKDSPFKVDLERGS